MTKMEQTTNAIAGAAVTSPLWLDWLRDVSTVAGFLVPIFGALWLMVQIANKINEMAKNRDDTQP